MLKVVLYRPERLPPGKVGDMEELLVGNDGPGRPYVGGTP